jgi:acrylyl-CoA reductase (NADPH)
MVAFKALRVSQDADTRTQSVSVMMLDQDQLPAGAVLIRGLWSGINYKDALAVTGQGRILRSFPMTPGIDVSGSVETSEDPRFKPGQSVLVTGCGLGEAHDGGYAGLVRVPGDWVVNVPDELGLDGAMVVGTAGFTAGMALLRMEQNGQTPQRGPILVNGATGGVGSFAVRLFSRAGYEVHALTGKPEAAEYLRALGAAAIVEADGLDYGSRPLETARWGGAVDNLGGEHLAWLTRTVQPWGSIAAVGLAAGVDLKTTVMPFILRGVSLLGINSVTCPRDLRLAVWTRLVKLLQPADLEVIRSACVGLEEVPAMAARLLSREVRGRVVVRLTDD